MSEAIDMADGDLRRRGGMVLRSRNDVYAWPGRDKNALARTGACGNSLYTLA